MSSGKSRSRVLLAVVFGLELGLLSWGIYVFAGLITKGIPESAGAPMLNVTVHSSCYPMDVPSIQRATDAEGLDYFEVQLAFVEAGDE